MFRTWNLRNDHHIVLLYLSVTMIIWSNRPHATYCPLLINAEPFTHLKASVVDVLSGGQIRCMCKGASFDSRCKINRNVTSVVTSSVKNCRSSYATMCINSVLGFWSIYILLQTISVMLWYTTCIQRSVSVFVYSRFLWSRIQLMRIASNWSVI